eukprot:1157574-Pelagomonas_calceolata.AAC.19
MITKIAALTPSACQQHALHRVQPSCLAHAPPFLLRLSCPCRQPLQPRPSTNRSLCRPRSCKPGPETSSRTWDVYGGISPVRLGGRPIPVNVRVGGRCRAPQVVSTPQHHPALRDRDLNTSQ